MRQVQVAGPSEAARLFTQGARILAARPEILESAGIAFACYGVNAKGEGRPAAALFVGRKATPSKHFIFRSTERRAAWIEAIVASAEYAAQARAQRSAERAAKAAAFVMPFAVGDVLEGSWGYDQTNVEFYEVTAIYGKRSVGVRALRQVETRSGGVGSMTEYVKPATGEGRFAGDELRKVVSVSGYVCFDCFSLSKWKGGERYQSHYA